MSAELRLALALGLGAVVTAVLTPLAIRVAGLTGFYDRPIGYKGHSRATPYLGGVAVVAGALTAALGIGAGSRYGWIVVLAVVLCAVGTIDDARTVGPGLRVLCELATGAVLWKVGLGWHVLGVDVLDLLLSSLWVVGVVNAFNLMDNMDGSAASVASVSAIGVCALALLADDATLGALALGVAASCLTFLTHNLRTPARIFLGDGGSMPVGLLVAASAMALSAHDQPGWPGLVDGLLVVGVVALDTTLVMVSRIRRRIALTTGGRDHLTHRLSVRLGSPCRVAAALAAIQVTFGVLALLVSRAGTGEVALAASGYLVFVGVTVSILESPTWNPTHPRSAT